MRGRAGKRAEFSLGLGGHFNVTLGGVKIPVTLRLTASSREGERKKEEGEFCDIRRQSYPETFAAGILVNVLITR